MTREYQKSMWTNGLRFLVETLWGEGEFRSFENNVFAIRPYTNDDEEFSQDTCNFYYKPTQTMVNWYKHIGRGMEFSQNLSNQDIGLIIMNCLKSLW